MQKLIALLYLVVSATLAMETCEKRLEINFLSSFDKCYKIIRRGLKTGEISIVDANNTNITKNDKIWGFIRLNSLGGIKNVEVCNQFFSKKLAVDKINFPHACDKAEVQLVLVLKGDELLKATASIKSILLNSEDESEGSVVDLTT